MSTLTEQFRAVDGRAFPNPGTYELDGSHTHAGFSVRHMGVAKVRGEFTRLSGKVVVEDDPTESSLHVTIEADSIDTRQADRDQHLKSPDFLDVATHPTLEFTSTSITKRGDGRYDIAGELTIRGTTRPVVLDAELAGVLVDPWGNERFGVNARTEINREDFGLTWNQALEAGGVLVGKKVTIEIEAEVVRPQG